MFCPKCGKQVQDSDMFCSNCGYQRIGANNVGVNQSYSAPVNQVHSAYNSNNLIENLRRKIRTEAIVWIIVASIQAIIGLVYILYDIDCKEASELISGIVLLVVAALNFLVCMSDFKYEKKIATEPVGIVEKYKPIGGYVGSLIYNLVFGGIVGVVGSIFCFVTRSYVIQNEQQFLAIENNYANQNVVKNN